ncbi:putative membrane protein [Spinactinospora alkalitolerans]|uniref:Putative membrane protein n=1 Tax=Spinactinospora alkalitolerans TaxID=687207 RepID=A0A852TZ80_9ACTN|nr:GPGG-motif small membrane protein [Spinactinospora alkalitolerans]NYE48332.1 putative membrane protein [Spinactinospora alkalitolerans]
MSILLLILGIVLIVAGVFALLRRQILWGVVLIVVGLIISPGGFLIG